MEHVKVDKNTPKNKTPKKKHTKHLKCHKNITFYFYSTNWWSFERKTMWRKASSIVSISFRLFFFGCFLYLIGFIADVVFGDKLIIKVCLICVRFPHGMCICVSLWILNTITCRSPWRLRWRVSKHNVLTSLVFIAKYFSRRILSILLRSWCVFSTNDEREKLKRHLCRTFDVRNYGNFRIRELCRLCNGHWQTVTIY